MLFSLRALAACDFSCESGTYESGDYCPSGYDYCKDIYHKSTAHVEGIDVWCLATLACDGPRTENDECKSDNKKQVVEWYVDCWVCDDLRSEIMDCPDGWECKNGACVECIDADNDNFCDEFEDRCVGTYGGCSGCPAPSCSVCKKANCPVYPDNGVPDCSSDAANNYDDPRCLDYDEYACYDGTDSGSDVYMRHVDLRCDGNGGCKVYSRSSYTSILDCGSHQYCHCTGSHQEDCICDVQGCSDNDQDSYYAISPTCPTGTDCDDNNANIHPGVSEICNNKDDDCDNLTDEGLTQGQNCGSGACYGTQTRTCTSGVWSAWSQCSTTGNACGTQDCDYLDSECRDYTDRQRYCGSNGICDTPTCTSYANSPSTTQCGTDYWEYGCPWGNEVDDDTGQRRHDYHCNGGGSCLDYTQSWVVDEACGTNQFCYYDGSGSSDGDYFCKDTVVGGSVTRSFTSPATTGSYPSIQLSVNPTGTETFLIEDTAPFDIVEIPEGCSKSSSKLLRCNLFSISTPRIVIYTINATTSGIYQFSGKYGLGSGGSEITIGGHNQIEIVSCNPADSDCDGRICFNEILAYIQRWVNNDPEVPFSKALEAVQAWVAQPESC
ncbi:MAG: putative metal-binding motif-containing protein [Candidatus Woesearchaeota archaeon]